MHVGERFEVGRKNAPWSSGAGDWCPRRDCGPRIHVVCVRLHHGIGLLRETRRRFPSRDALLIACRWHPRGRGEGFDQNGDFRRGKSRRFGAENELFGSPGAALQDDLGEAVEERALVALLRFMAAGIAIAQADDVPCALQRKSHRVHGGGDLVSLRIERADGHRHGVAAVTGYR